MTGTIEALLSSMGSRGGSDNSGGDAVTSRPLETCLEELQNQVRRMQAPCPFRVGDVVTVRNESDVKGAGNPHVVAEVFNEPVTDSNGESGSNQFLRKYTMRVCHYYGDTVTVHAVDHSCFEIWTAAHASAWQDRQAAASRKSSRKVARDTPLTEVVRLLRGEGRKMADAKITWKKGDLVELTGHEMSHAAKPMTFEGRAVGFVVSVDHSDDTTKVVYFDDDGDRRSQWFKPVDLKSFTAVEPV